jgi:hypothetical protein
MGVHLQKLLDRMTERLGENPNEVNPENVKQAASEIARSVASDDETGIWMEDGPALLALAWSADPKGHLYNVWSMELRHEGGHAAGSTNGE